MKLNQLGEFGLIEQIRHRSPTGPEVLRGIGDDATELRLPEGHHLHTSTDLLIEGIHFRRDWTDCASLGRKAVAVNLSDMAAMGAVPRYLYLGLACPGDTAVDDLDAFLDGALAEAGRYGVALVGGDTCRSPGPWMISVTVEGSSPAGEAIGRDGARADDLIMVSGTLGDSALALHLLSAGRTPAPELLARHHRPTARVELGRRLAGERLAGAMIDVSDGLAADLQHILRASRVDGLVETARIPLSAAFACGVEEAPELRDLALCGGEDYELLFTVPPRHAAQAVAAGAALGLPVTAIGVIRPGSGRLALRDADGGERPAPAGGYDHFGGP